MGKELDIDVVENDVLGAVVPVVNGEQVAVVHVRPKRSRPLSLPEPRFSNKNERAWSFHLLHNLTIQ